MYSQITSNKRKTIFLISLFAVIVVLLGWIFGLWSGNEHLGIIIAVIIATIMILIGYYKGDTVSLAVSGAKEIEKQDYPELYRVVENLCIASGIATPKIYVMNDPSPNAFATGRNPEHATVAVTTGLLTIMNKSELEGVIAHELSHIKNYDIRIMTIVVVLVGAIVLISNLMSHSMFHKNSNNNSNNNSNVLVLIGIILALLSPIFAELIKLAVSRSREYLADASGALLTRYPDGLANALEKIACVDKPLKKANRATAHLFIANPFDPCVAKKFESLFSTHPLIEKRIEELRKMSI